MSQEGPGWLGGWLRILNSHLVLASGVEILVPKSQVSTLRGQKGLWTCHGPSNRPVSWPLFFRSFIQRPRLQNKMWLEGQPPLRPGRFQKHFGMQCPRREASVWQAVFPCSANWSFGLWKQPAVTGLALQPRAAPLGILVGFQSRRHRFPSVLPVTLPPVCR